MSTHNICFCGEIRKRFLVEKKNKTKKKQLNWSFGILGYAASEDLGQPVQICSPIRIFAGCSLDCQWSKVFFFSG